MQNDSFEILILGAGASGLMLSSLLSGLRVGLVDINGKIGAKLLVTGGGGCNICNKNLSRKNFLADSKFIAPALKEFNQKRLYSWFESRGVELLPKRGGKVFCKDGSGVLVKFFQKSIKDIDLFLNHEILSLDFDSSRERFILTTNRGKLFAQKVVVATGGISFPKLGATDIGFKIARDFGHTITKLAPALVGFTLQREQFFMKELSGVSTDVKIRVGDRVFEDSLLFTHKGISGPAILNASLYWEKGSIKIDFLPNFELKNLRGRKQLSTILPMPKRASKAFLHHLNLKDKALNLLTKEDFRKLELLKRYQFAPAGTFGYSKAEVTKGGIDTGEIDSETMMSKRQKNLFFIGEVLNVTGELGGYNLQWAFSSAWSCAKGLAFSP